MNFILKPKNVFQLLFLFALLSSGCRKDREPWNRIDIKDPGYTINCLNCISHNDNGNVSTYSSINIHFTMDSPVTITEDAYIKVDYSLDNGKTGEFLIDYKDIKFDQHTVSFNAIINYSTSSNLHNDITFYTGKGSKSNTLGLDIAKPAGAAKLL